MNQVGQRDFRDKNVNINGGFVMSVFEENIKEIIVLSDLLLKHEFRACFVNHFISKVKEFEHYKSSIDLKILQKLQWKLLEPLLYHLNGRQSVSEKELLVDGVIKVLHIAPIDSVVGFFDVYARVFFEIYKNGDLPHQPSEELIEKVLECTSYLFKNSTRNVLEKVYAKESASKLSLGIFVAVNIVKEEKSIKLRVAALDFLLAATHYESQTKYSKDLYNQIGDLFMLYLPGILGPLLEVILRDETQHHLITVRALSCWGHVLCTVMKDLVQKETLSEDEILKNWMNNQKLTESEIYDVKEGLKEKERNTAWLRAAAVTLQPLIEKLSNVKKHSNPKCRLELTHVMVKILKNCLRNLQKNLSVVIEVLVSSSMDEDEDVRKVAEKALEEFESEFDNRNIGVFVSVVEENLYSIISKLPGIMKSQNEQLILPTLRSLSGYLKILGRLDRLRSLLSLSSTLRKLVSALKLSFELELYPELSVQDFSVLDEDAKSTIWCKRWKRFKYFSDESISAQFEEICRAMGNFGPAETILDFLVDSFNEEQSFRNETLLILNQVILGGSKEIKDHVVDHLLSFYLDRQNLYPPLQVNSNVNLREVQSNVLQVALIMEGIGKLAKSLGNRFRDCLLKSLYYVLERMGSSHSTIRDAAENSAVEIATACELKDVKSLIAENVDYLSYHLTIKLKRKEESVFSVVGVLMKNSPLESLPNLEEIINGVLESSSRNLDSHLTVSYLRLFQTFVCCVRKWMKTDDEIQIPEPKVENTESQRLTKFLESLIQTEEPEIEIDPEKESSLDVEEVEPKEPEKPELPKHLKLTLAVANHCLHFLASKDNDKKIIVLEILNECVWALNGWENDLLPLVHNIWSPLVTRFDSTTEPLVVNRSFTLLCSLSFTSKDFIRRRTLKNVLPTLESFLSRQAATSKLKNSASGYFFTQNYKLQREILSNLGKLTLSLGLFERESDLVVECALPYLSRYQPQELQEKCRNLFEDLKKHDVHLVWFKLNHLAADSEYGDNVNIILNKRKRFASSPPPPPQT